MKTHDEIKKGLECCQLAFGFRECGSRCPYYKDRCCGVLLAKDAKDLIQQLESRVPRWISVEERLPEKLKRVLVFKQRNGHSLWCVAMWNIEIDWRGESDWSKNPDNGWFTVTHWMPLPESPEA